MSGTYESDMYTAAAQVRTLSAASSTTADPTWATAVTILGYWEKRRRRASDGNGGFAYVVEDVLITSGQISGTATYITPTHDDLYFDPGADATKPNNGWQPMAGGVDVFPDVDGASGVVHHYEIHKP